MTDLMESLITARDSINTLTALNHCQGVYYYEAIKKANEALERAAVDSRNVLEQLHFNQIFDKADTLSLPNINISGKATIFEYGWLYIKLNTLLPNCRYQTPLYLGDTIRRLLDSLAVHKKIPYFKDAMMVIDEHCSLKNRKVFDQDNKGWKAVSNTLKGRVFQDDDQFHLGVVLVSTLDETPSCNIFVFDKEDTGTFFNLYTSGALYW